MRGRRRLVGIRAAACPRVPLLRGGSVWPQSGGEQGSVRPCRAPCGMLAPHGGLLSSGTPPSWCWHHGSAGGGPGGPPVDGATATQRGGERRVPEPWLLPSCHGVAAAVPAVPGRAASGAWCRLVMLSRGAVRVDMACTGAVRLVAHSGADLSPRRAVPGRVWQGDALRVPPPPPVGARGQRCPPCCGLLSWLLPPPAAGSLSARPGQRGAGTLPRRCCPPAPSWCCHGDPELV